MAEQRIEVAQELREQSIDVLSAGAEQNIEIGSEPSILHGIDGVSPIATVTQTETGATISITDRDGTTTATITNGQDGERGPQGERGERGEQGIQGIQGIQGEKGDRGEQGIQGERGEQGLRGERGATGATGATGPAGPAGSDGADGFSPTATITKSGKVATITITDKNGTTTQTISDGNDGQNGSDGRDGQDGNDGFSPTATVAKSGDTATITITDKNGTTTAQIKDGSDATVTVDSALSASSENPVQNKVINSALNAKADSSDIPTKTSDLTNDAGFITGYTETDPIYSASVASGITSANITAWNNKSDFSGNYNDLTNKPTIPTVNNATITIQRNSATVDSFTVNASQNKSINIAVPTKTSDLTNDSDFIEDASYVHTDNNYTTAEKNKLAGIATGAEANVQADWTQATTTADDYIKNKPTLATVATSGNYNDLSNKPTIPTAVTVDSALSNSSTNPVQNKVITAAIGDVESILTTLNNGGGAQ